MAKPTITTRDGKGAALTYSELDTNFTNLRDASITVTDGVNSTAIDLNGTIQFTSGSNVTVTENNGVITIASTAGSGLTDSDTILLGQQDADTVVLSAQSTGPQPYKGIQLTNFVTNSDERAYLTLANSGSITLHAGDTRSLLLETPQCNLLLVQGVVSVAGTKLQLAQPVRVWRQSTAQIATITAEAGMIVFDSTTNEFKGYNGTTWVVLG